MAWYWGISSGRGVLGVDGNCDSAILATKSYVSLVKTAQNAGYRITLLFIWLDSPATAMRRVADRVGKGGHNIPEEIIERRYYRGIINLINLYSPICDRWMVVDNETITLRPIAEGGRNTENIVINEYIWDAIIDQAKRDGAK